MNKRMQVTIAVALAMISLPFETADAAELLSQNATQEKAAGPAVTADQLAQSQQTAENLVQKKNALNELAQASAPTQPKVAALTIQQSYKQLVGTLQSNQALRDAFNKLFGASVPKNGKLSDANAVAVYAVVGDPNYDHASFITVLPKTYALYTALQVDPYKRDQYNSLFGASIQATGSPNADDRGRLFGTAGDPAFVLADFLRVLPLAYSVYTGIKNDPYRLEAVNSLFDASISSAGPLSPDDRKTLFDMAGDPQFNLSDFFRTLPYAYELYKSIVANPEKYSGPFSRIFPATAIEVGVPLSADARKALFEAMLPGPSVTKSIKKFLKVLFEVDKHYTKLQTNPGKLKKWNKQHPNAQISESGPPSVAARQALFDFIGGQLFG